MQTISLKLPDELHQLLASEAKSRQVTKSQVLRESLLQTLRRPAPPGEPSCFDLASDLAGAVGGLSEDLATNPRYLDHFGR